MAQTEWIEAPEYAVLDARRKAMGVFIIGSDGLPASFQSNKSYTLAEDFSGQGSTTPVADVPGGEYILTIVASLWNGATATLQFLGPDGVTWMDSYTDAGELVQTNANGALTGRVGANSTIRLTITDGEVDGLYASLS